MAVTKEKNWIPIYASEGMVLFYVLCNQTILFYLPETSAYEIAAQRLFEHMVGEDKSHLWWEQLLDAIVEWTVAQGKPRPTNIIKQPFCQLFTLPHCRVRSGDT
jgi:hypothetical protein